MYNLSNNRLSPTPTQSASEAIDFAGFNYRSKPNPLFLNVDEKSAIFSFKSFLPDAPFCTDNYEKGCYRVPKKYAIKQAYDYIQFNSSNSIKLLVIDIDDHPDIWELIHSNKIPRPNFACLNQQKMSKDKPGSGHLYYMLNTAVHNNANSSSEALRYFDYIRKCITLLVGGDFSFAQTLAKNPLSDRWYTLELRNEGYDLSELAEYCSLELHAKALEAEKQQKNIVSTIETKTEKTDVKNVTSHRNCYIFDTVRVWAYKAVRGAKNYESWLQAVYQRVAIVNAKLPEPKPLSDVNSISNSIAKWTYQNIGVAHTAAFIQKQKERGAKGGKAKGEAYAEIKLRAKELAESGVSNAAIADQLNVSRMTVIRWSKKGFN